MIAAAPLAAQGFGVICTTDVPYATGFSNSHKLAAPSELDTALTLVFQSSEAIHYCIGVCDFTGIEWEEPVTLYPGQNPAIACGTDGDRHIVWQFPDTSSGTWEVYYRNLEYRMMPVNVSTTNGQSMHPDVRADDIAHVVWEEWSYDPPRILYRTCDENGLIGDPVLVSDDDTTVACGFPSIEKYGGRLCVLWQACDSASYAPYSIRRRWCDGGVWMPVETLAMGPRVLRHPSLDIGSQGEVFAGAWEDSSSFYLEAHFEGGNPGGGVHTSGRSTWPVYSNLGHIWSYLFWEEDEFNEQDILRQTYYFGWGSVRSLRQEHSIDQNLHCPSALRDIGVWTAGDSAPCVLMWEVFGLPIGVAEEPRLRTGGTCVVAPNPGRGPVTFRFADAGRRNSVEAVDAAGRTVWRWSGTAERVRWESPAAGVYFARVRDGDRRETVELVRY